MKTVLIITVLILAILLITGFYTMTKAKTETQKFKTIYVKDNFEIRYYPTAILATVKMDKSFDEYRSSGFRILAGYIFGGNKENKSIAMTSPVRMSEDEKNKIMSFVLPSEMEFEKLPEPNNTNILLHQSKPVYTASLRFGGFASESEISKYKIELGEILKNLKLENSGSFEFLAYNPPYQLVNRRNEVIVELIDFNAKAFEKEIAEK